MWLLFRAVKNLLTGNFRALFALLLGLALLVTLWEMSLVRISEQGTATAILTQVGIEVINPTLQSYSVAGHHLGVSALAYPALERQAAAHPDQAITIPGLKVRVLGREIAGKSFDQAMAVVYARMAAAFYGGGAGAVFALPAPALSAIGQLSLVPQGQTTVTLPNGTAVPDHLPSPPVPLAAIGLSINTLTASGHAATLKVFEWAAGISLILMLLLGLLGSGWRRLTSIAWAIFGAALPGVIALGIATFLTRRYAQAFAPFSGVIGLLGQVFVPVYGGAAAVAVLAIVAALVGRVLFKGATLGADAARVAAGVTMGARRAGSGQPPAAGAAGWYVPGAGAPRGDASARGAPPRDAPYAPPRRAPREYPPVGYPPAGYPPASSAPAEPPWPSSGSLDPPTPGYGGSPQPGYPSLGPQPRYPWNGASHPAAPPYPGAERPAYPGAAAAPDVPADAGFDAPAGWPATNGQAPRASRWQIPPAAGGGASGQPPRRSLAPQRPAPPTRDDAERTDRWPPREP